VNTSTKALVQLWVQCIVAIAVVAYCMTSAIPIIHSYWYLEAAFVVAGAVAEALPITVVRAGSRMDYDAGGMVAVACVLLFPTSVAALTISCGILLGRLFDRAGMLRSLHIWSNLTSSAFLAIFVAHLISPPELSARGILAAVVAYLVMDISSNILVSLKFKLSGQRRFWNLAFTSFMATSGLSPWVATVGILLGALGTKIPWALPLTAAPLALVFLASQARIAATEDRTHLDSLLGATTAILDGTSVSGVIETTTTAAAAIFEGQEARIDDAGPMPGELGTELVSQRLGTQYLVVGVRDAMMRRYSDQDQRMLVTLASIAATALDKAALHEDVTEQATIDPLTGLMNRRAFEEQVRAALSGMRASDGSGIIFLDLDGFKQINDTHGHQAGDEVLVETAHRLSAAVRGGDVVARLGGDEFTILLRGVHTAADATLVADRILDLMREPIALTTGVAVSTTPSVGISLALQTGADAVQLLKEADAAMYEAKRAGKDCWRLAHDGLTLAVGE
jgi:diguanylate cyclase (GGDEF)-like protein